MLLHHLKFNRVLHERAVLLTVMIEDIPRVPPGDRLEVEYRKQGIMQLVLHFGFMEDPDVPRALQYAQSLGLDVDRKNATYYVGSLTLIPEENGSRMALWREKLYVLMTRNAAQSTDFYGLPPERVVEIGIQVVL